MRTVEQIRSDMTTCDEMKSELAQELSAMSEDEIKLPMTDVKGMLLREHLDNEISEAEFIRLMLTVKRGTAFIYSSLETLRATFKSKCIKRDKDDLKVAVVNCIQLMNKRQPLSVST